MRLISHRGNLNGKKIDLENTPKYIQQALDQNIDVEIDVWVKDSCIFLGHDKPLYEITLSWILERKTKLWLHCKNIEALCYLKTLTTEEINFFWHENDTVTLTSKGYLWAFPGKQPINESVAVLPELYNDCVDTCFGVCTDWIVKYKV
jgi:hypothetical protein